MHDESERPSSKHSAQGEQKTLSDTFNGLSNADCLEAQDEDLSVLADLDDYTGAAPRISRESILRKVRNTKYDFEDEDEDEEGDYSELMDEQHKFRPSYAELAQMHPDQPIPSRENSIESREQHIPRQHSIHDEEDVVIKE